MRTNQITREEMQERAEAEIKKVTCAVVEVVFLPSKMLIHTEDLHLVDSIKTFMLMVKNSKLADTTFYEADEDLPASINLEYALV